MLIVKLDFAAFMIELAELRTPLRNWNLSNSTCWLYKDTLRGLFVKNMAHFESVLLAIQCAPGVQIHVNEYVWYISSSHQRSSTNCDGHIWLNQKKENLLGNIVWNLEEI